MHSRGAADTNALSPQFLLVLGQNYYVEEDRRPDRDEDIFKAKYKYSREQGPSKHGICDK